VRSNYTTVSNDIFDSGLKPECIGVLCFILCGDTPFLEKMPEQLAIRFRCSKQRIYRIIRDLEKAGYLERIIDRDVCNGRYKGITYSFSDKAMQAAG